MGSERNLSVCFVFKFNVCTLLSMDNLFSVSHITLHKTTDATDDTTDTAYDTAYDTTDTQGSRSYRNFSQETQSQFVFQIKKDNA